MVQRKRWNQNSSDAAAIVKDYAAGRITINGFDKFIRNRQNWIDPD